VSSPLTSDGYRTDYIEVSVSEFRALKHSLASVRRRLSAGCKAATEAEGRFAAMNGHTADGPKFRQLGLDILGTYSESFDVEKQILEALEEYLDCMDDDEMLSHETWDLLVPGLANLEELRETLVMERLVLTQCGR
jgi:hypothetical protein